MSSLTAAWADIDAFSELPDLLREAGSSVNSTQLAFRVWNRTILSRERTESYAHRLEQQVRERKELLESVLNNVADSVIVYGPGDTVLDCGANVGVYTKYALERGAAEVIAIEPAPLPRARE